MAHGLQPTDAPPGLLTVHVLDADGRWREASLTSVPPIGDAEGETLQERGAARYLGVYFSFERTGGNAKTHHREEHAPVKLRLVRDGVSSSHMGNRF